MKQEEDSVVANGSIEGFPGQPRYLCLVIFPVQFQLAQRMAESATIETTFSFIIMLG
jgi:hypothetical protein